MNPAVLNNTEVGKDVSTSKVLDEITVDEILKQPRALRISAIERIVRALPDFNGFELDADGADELDIYCSYGFDPLIGRLWRTHCVYCKRDEQVPYDSGRKPTYLLDVPVSFLFEKKNIIEPDGSNDGQVNTQQYGGDSGLEDQQE